MDLGMYQKDIDRIIEVSTDTITNWEKGRTKPNKQNLEKIATLLANEDSKPAKTS